MKCEQHFLFFESGTAFPKGMFRSCSNVNFDAACISSVCLRSGAASRAGPGAVWAPRPQKAEGPCRDQCQLYKGCLFEL
jgi:hypothetical protein